MSSAIPPIFIGGCGRSGTTLLADMLGSHEALSPIYETDFVPAILGMLMRRDGDDLAPDLEGIRSYMEEWSRPLPHRPHSKHEGERYRHGPHYVLFSRDEALEATETLCRRAADGDPVNAFRDFVLGLFARHAEHDGKPYWVNKTPSYVLIFPLLRTLFPDARFLHCLRDPRDTARSIAGRPWGPDTITEAGQYWAHQVEKGIRFGNEHPGQTAVVRYEDLVLQPGRTLSNLLAWLGLEAGGHALAGAYFSGAQEPHAARIGAWKNHLTAEEAAFFTEHFAPLMQRYGYE